MKRTVAGLATLAAVALTVEGTIGKPPDQLDLRGAIPQNLRPDEYVVGVPWTGEPGKPVSVATLEAITAREPKIAGPIERRHEQRGGSEHFVKRANPDAPAVASWPLAEPRAAPERGRAPSILFSAATGFDGPSFSESGFVPPDSIGAVGPSHVMVLSNGVFKIFTKSGTPIASFSDDALFASVKSSGVSVSDPHVRYDRTSGRWFITEIDVANVSNKILVAVSSGSDITASSSFTVYGFAHDAPGGGGIDAGHFADYDTLGVDANALNIGVNEFTNSVSTFLNTSAYVIRKSSVISGGPIVVTAFRGLAVGSGPGAYTPQGVQNDDPAAAEGYFIGVANDLFSQLVLYRVSTPGTTPALSGAMTLTVGTTDAPIDQPAMGGAPLDALDDRLFAAEVHTNRYSGRQTLWTAHNIAVNNAGIAGSVSPAPDRNGARWYEIGNLTTTPMLMQANTVFDSSPSAAGVWIPSMAMNGQGFALLSASYASATTFAGIAFAGRLSMVGNLDKSLAVSTAGVAAYDVQGDVQRWGDYSQTVVDPNDDMTIWSFQEYVSAQDEWTVRATKYMAPPPATLSPVTPRVVPKSASTVIQINGIANPGLFFDPGPGFPHRLSVSFSGGVTVNAITAVGATQIQVDVNTLAAARGAINVTVTNPDGQTSAGTALFAVSAVGGDFDADMKADMTLYKSTGEWDILASTSGYTTSTTVNVGGPGYVPVAGDYDGDGRQDPAAYNTTTGQWLALKSSTAYTTTFSQTWGGPGYIPEPGDYDGDGKADLAVYVEAASTWYILKSSTNFTTTLNVAWGGVGYTPVPGQDFDGDGKADIAVYSESAGAWNVLKSSTNFTTALNINWGGHGYTLVAGDYDGDGKADPGLYERSTGNWYILKSNAGYTTTINVGWGGAGYEPVPGDYDGDGKFDLGIVQRSTGNWYVLKSSTSYTTSFNVTGWGVSTDTLVSGAIRVGGSDLVRATDFDADGKADITVYSGAGMWLTLNSSAAYATSTSRSWGGSGYTPAPGDFDGDGKVDYSIYQNSTGNWFVLLSGAGFTTSLNKSAGGGLYVPVVGDYDGDGKSDFAVYDGSTGNWFVLKSSTGYTTTLSINWGGTGYAPAPGDFDGDGKTDLGVYQPSSGNWYVLLSSSNYTTSLSKSAGGPGYSAAAGDYDGDGKADFVVYNGTSGLWFGLKSSTGYTTTVSVSWGGPGYQNVQGDFDGDGKVDLALYQTSTGNWSILLSGSGYTTTLNKSWGGTGYVPVPLYP